MTRKEERFLWAILSKGSQDIDVIGVDDEEDHELPPPLFALSPEEYLDILKAYKEYRPLDSEESFYLKAFGKGFKDLSTVVMRLPSYKHLLVQKAVSELLKGWRVINAANFGFAGNMRPIRHIQLEVDYNIKEDAIRSGVLLYESNDGDRIAVQFDMSEDRSGEDAKTEVNLTSHKEKQGYLESLAIEIEEWVKDHNYFKGKKIRPDATFISLDRLYDWDDIVLDVETKERIRQNINSYFELRRIYRRNRLPFKRGMICYGPPGTGKTLLGKVLASQIESTFIWVTPSYITNAEGIREIFDMARELTPSIIFFEDIDLFVYSRESNDKAEVLGEFLAQMDGFIENEDIFVIATTNDIKAIEPALKDRPSRFDVAIEFKPFDRELCKKMLNYLLREYQTKEDKEDLADKVANTLDDMTGAELKEFFISTVKTAIEEREFDDQGRVILSFDSFIKTQERLNMTRKRLIGFGGSK